MYDVFISYARKDYVDEKGHVLPGNPVSRVMKSLSDAGISYWFDTQGIYSGDDFAEKIITSIEKSEIFVFLSTEHANHSPWTRKEIACAHELNKRIIPVRIDHSSYDKAVMFRIVDLDYIDYARNPELALQELVKTIQASLKEKKAEEEQRRKKEEVELKIKAELEAIELQARQLQNESARLELERKKLQLEISQLEHSQHRVEPKPEPKPEPEPKPKPKPELKTVQEQTQPVPDKADVEEDVSPVVPDAKAPKVLPVTVSSCLILGLFVIPITFFIINRTRFHTTLFGVATAICEVGVILMLNKYKLGYLLFSSGVLLGSIQLGFFVRTNPDYPIYAFEGVFSFLILLLGFVFIAAAYGILQIKRDGIKAWDMLGPLMKQ